MGRAKRPAWRQQTLWQRWCVVYWLADVQREYWVEAPTAEDAGRRFEAFWTEYDCGYPCPPYKVRVSH